MGAVFCVTEQDFDLHRYDVADDSWTTVNGNVPDVGLGINLTYSLKYHSLYYYRNNVIRRYDIASDAWSQDANSAPMQMASSRYLSNWHPL